MPAASARQHTSSANTAHTAASSTAIGTKPEEGAYSSDHNSPYTGKDCLLEASYAWLKPAAASSFGIVGDPSCIAASNLNSSTIDASCPAGRMLQCFGKLGRHLRQSEQLSLCIENTDDLCFSLGLMSSEACLAK